MDSLKALDLCRDVLLNLEENILPYWMNKMVASGGGFYARRDGYDKLDETAPKGAVLNARILWTFSAAYRQLGNPAYLKMATRAKREIIDRFYDREFGGVFWSVDSAGVPLDTKKQFYALGFAIYGLSEYARATGDVEAKEYAVRLFYDIEKHSRDRKNGGYIEALNRDWTPLADMRLSEKDKNACKTMNTHLHIIEPYANLLRIWNTDELREATKSLMDIFFNKIMIDERGGHLGLFFDEKWNLLNPRTISYGHDIEASWLLFETAMILDDKELCEKTLELTSRIGEAALEGRLADGSMIYEKFTDGSFDTDRHWWVQAENVIGQLYLYVFHGRREMLGKACESWKYIKENIVDHVNGEWFWSVRDGFPVLSEDKAGFWKCPYHNARMCLQALDVLTEMLAS